MKRIFVLFAAALALAGCTHHTIKVEPIEIKPIEATINVNLRIDRELDQFFDFEKPVEAAPPVAPATQDTGTNSVPEQYQR
ncbi:MAG: lipoprotein [Phycisphaeraceae bacterium]